ncbi:MAG: ABC transporter permease [Oligoflexia bacterium]|nr:ABC transporter permease [Oligoflexia bacterium]
MKIFWVHLSAQLKELIRQWDFVLLTVIFPSLFYFLFAAPEANTKVIANFLVGSFAAFAVFGVVFFQFAIASSQEKSNAWTGYVRTLPVSGFIPLAARIVSCLLFGGLSAVAVSLVAIKTSPADLEVKTYMTLLPVLLLGAIPFGFLGLIVGYAVNPRAAMPLANLIYLLSSFLGGLWRPPELLPESFKEISKFIPTRHYGEIVWAVIEKRAWPMGYFAALVFEGVLFGMLAVWLYQMESKSRYS